LTAAKFIAVRFLLLFAAFVYVKIDIKFEMLNSAAEVLSPVYDLGLWELPFVPVRMYCIYVNVREAALLQWLRQWIQTVLNLMRLHSALAYIIH